MYKVAFCCLFFIFVSALGSASATKSSDEAPISCPYVALTGKISQHTFLDSENVYQSCWILEISDGEMKRLIQAGYCFREDSLVNDAKNYVQIMAFEVDLTEFIDKEVIVLGYLRLVFTNIITPITIETKGVYMELSDEAIDFLEEHIPELAGAAIKQAYWNALASGFSVLQSENGALVEVHPDGTRKIIKQLPPGIPVVRGQKLRI